MINYEGFTAAATRHMSDCLSLFLDINFYLITPGVVIFTHVWLVFTAWSDVRKN